MKEATSGCTVWEDVDEDTFVRFGQYLYTGNYEGSSPLVTGLLEFFRLDSGEFSKIPKPAAHTAVIPDTDEPAHAEPEPEKGEADYWAYAATSSKKSKKSKIRLVDLQGDLDKRFVRPAEEEAAPAPLPPSSPQTMKTAWDDFKTKRSYECGVAGTHYCPVNEDRQTEYMDVFLSHARVHMLADYYNIQALAQLALHKLHRTLCRFTLHEERIGDVVALLRYCYEEDERPLLRELVSAFAACHAKRLWKSIEFQELFAAHGELSRAVMGSIMDIIR